jgi:hypothetical protein
MLDAYRDLIDELLETPSDIRVLIEAPDAPTPSDEARRLIAELRDRDRAVLDRVQAITRNENPYLRPLRVAPSVGDEEMAAILKGFEVARGDLVSHLINLSLRDWERVAIHETAGEVTLADEIEEHVEFDEEHRQRIRELLTAPS